MSQSIFHVRPLDAGKGWAIDEYDGRGAWQSTYRNNAKGEPLDKQEAQRRVFQLRRKAVNSAPATEPVNKKCQCAGPDYEAAMGHLPGCFFAARNRNDVACADVADSTDPRLLIKVAHQHWWGIGWPEDAMPIALLERAMELLDPDAQLEAARRQDAETRKRLGMGQTICDARVIVGDSEGEERCGNAWPCAAHGGEREPLKDNTGCDV